MGVRKDLAVSYSRLTREEVETFCVEWGIEMKFKPVALGMDVSIDWCPAGSIALYSVWLGFCISRFCVGRVVMTPPCCRSATSFVETSKADICLVSSMVTTLGAWKDRFFWVSDEIIPFKMVWRQPDTILNEPEPSASEINTRFLKIIREYPSRVCPFPEQLLVLLGISKLWDKPNRDPVLMRDGQGIYVCFGIH
ncbi:hypothetical protein Hanom_Chr09g00780361 [Helianthus anomalus]